MFYCWFWYFWSLCNQKWWCSISFSLITGPRDQNYFNVSLLFHLSIKDEGLRNCQSCCQLAKHGSLDNVGPYAGNILNSHVFNILPFGPNISIDMIFKYINYLDLTKNKWIMAIGPLRTSIIFHVLSMYYNVLFFLNTSHVWSFNLVNKPHAYSQSNKNWYFLNINECAHKNRKTSQK